MPLQNNGMRGMGEIMVETESLSSNYDKLLAKAKDVVILQSAYSILYWDMETKMPPKGIDLRSQQLAMLSQITHRISTDPEIGFLLEKIERHLNYESLSEFQRRNVHLIRKFYDEQTKLPEKLVVETSKQQAVTMDAWRKAKTAKDFSMFKPDLEKLFNLKKQAADILMTVKHTATPYDALIDIYEPKMTSDSIATIFDRLKPDLISIIEKCVGSPKQPDVAILSRKVPLSVQEEVSKSLAEFLDYDVASKNAGGRIDETEHPFTTGYFDDVRITTHYHEDNFASSLFSILHEGGHAIYEQNLNREWLYQPIGSSCSSGFHESQSRFVENMVGRSREFWMYYLPRLKAFTGNALSDANLDSFVHAINKVKPSKIRIEADEVTYSLHIIIRFEIEKDLFAEKITVDELPQIWNQKYMNYLNQKIENDSEGMMQDIHWSSGDFGYFPSYALGNIFGGQILKVMEKDMPNWRELLAKGNFSHVKQWLIKNVYTYGNLYDPLDLLKKITGEEINHRHFIDYLNAKYSGLYGY
jgi:carboxypeptidase Taq